MALPHEGGGELDYGDPRQVLAHLLENLRRDEGRAARKHLSNWLALRDMQESYAVEVRQFGRIAMRGR